MVPQDEISEVGGSRMPQDIKRQDKPVEPMPEEPEQREQEPQKDSGKENKHHGGKDPNTGRKLDVDG